MFLGKETIFLDKNFSGKEAIFRFLAVQAEKQGWTEDAAALEADLWTRENEYHTGFDGKIAMPHVKTANVKESGVMFIRLPKSIIWEGHDSGLIKLVCAIFIPEKGARRLHLHIINELMCQIIDDKFRQILLEAINAQEIFNFMSDRITEMDAL